MTTPTDIALAKMIFASLIAASRFRDRRGQEARNGFGSSRERWKQSHRFVMGTLFRPFFVGQSRIAGFFRPPGSTIRQDEARGWRKAPSLFHILLNRAAEREQPLVDRGGHLTDKFDHAPPVLENPRFPGELIAEIVDLGLIRRGRALQFLQSDG